MKAWYAGWARGTDVRIAWLLSAIVLLLGYAMLIAPRERRMTAIETRAHALYEQANRNARLVENIGSLERARDRVKRDLALLTGVGGADASMLGGLQLLQRETHAHRVTLRAFTPQAANGSATVKGQQPFTILARGRYRDVMGLIADLPRHGVFVEVRDAQLRRVPSRGALAPDVDATIDAVLYDDITALVKGVTHV